jgi:hypothetical protein
MYAERDLLLDWDFPYDPKRPKRRGRIRNGVLDFTPSPVPSALAYAITKAREHSVAP